MDILGMIGGLYNLIIFLVMAGLALFAIYVLAMFLFSIKGLDIPGLVRNFKDGGKTLDAMANLTMIKEDCSKYQDLVEDTFLKILKYLEYGDVSLLDFNMSQELKEHFNKLDIIKNKIQRREFVKLNNYRVTITALESFSEGYLVKAEIKGAGIDFLCPDYGNTVNINTGFENRSNPFTATIGILIGDKYSHFTNCPCCGGIMDEDNTCLYCSQKQDMDREPKVVEFSINLRQCEVIPWR